LLRLRHEIYKELSMKGNFWGIIVAFLFAMTLLHVPAYAQDVASISGTVTDTTGAVVSDAGVKLTNTRTGATYEAKTGDDGSYRFLRVQPGPGYLLTVSKDGFQTVTISDLYLAVATTRTQDLKLQVGTVSQTVEVKSEGSVSLNTTDATVGNNFDMRTVHELPQQFRDNPANLLRLEPGVQSAASVDDPNGNRDGSVTGARTDQNNIVVDGIDGQDFAIGQAFALVAPIPVDAVQEFRTDVANPTSDFGRGSGSTTVITTKSGTNNWHGSAREYHRNAVTEANSFFNNAAGVPRPALIRNQFGANLGGPVKKDKLFFFFDFDARRDAKQDSVLRIVPLDSVRNGELSYVNSSSPSCTNASRISTQPSCITTLPATAAPTLLFSPSLILDIRTPMISLAETE
jgi:carboxypeptidase family protein